MEKMSYPSGWRKYWCVKKNEKLFDQIYCLDKNKGSNVYDDNTWKSELIQVIIYLTKNIKNIQSSDTYWSGD